MVLEVSSSDIIPQFLWTASSLALDPAGCGFRLLFCFSLVCTDIKSAFAGVVATTNVEEACKGVQVAIMVGGFPRKEGMERKDVMTKNVSIYKAQASALEKFADKDCKVGHMHSSYCFTV